VGFSPDSQLIATGDQNGRIVLWQAKDGTRLRSWRGHHRSAAALAFSPDSRLLASGGWEGGVAIREVSTGGEIGFFLTEEAHIHAIDFSPDGNHLAAVGEKGFVSLWSLDQLSPPTRFIGHDHLVFEVVATPDGRQLASVSRDGTLRLWDARTGIETNRLRRKAFSVDSVDINVSGTRMATRGSNGEIRIWELPSGRLLRSWSVDPRVRNLRFSPDGALLAAGAHRHGARPSTPGPAVGIWDPETGRQQRQLEGHRGDIKRMDFRPDGQRLATTSHHGEESTDGRVLVWDLETGESTLTLQPEGNPVSNAVLWTPDGKRILTGHGDGRICFWAAETGALERTLLAHGEMVGALELSRDGNRLLSSAWYSSEIKLWDGKTGEFRYALDTGIPGVSDTGFADDDQSILVAGMDGGLKRFRVGARPPGWESVHPPAGAAAESFREKEKALLARTFDSETAYRSSVEGFLVSHRPLQETLSGTQGQVPAAILDELSRQAYEEKRYDRAEWTLKQALSLAPSEDRKRRLIWLTEVLKANVSPESADDLNRYVGQYEEREFFLRGSDLIYRHLDFDRESRLLPLGPGRFLVEDAPTTRLVFPATAGEEKPQSVQGQYFMGGEDLSLRSPE
ncbi:MAG: WD40 repeat domain-containing protein, partial [Verrucomicrobiota bacterium]